MAKRLAFSVAGEPKGKGRARAIAAIREGPDGKPEAFVRMVTPSDTREAEAKVRAAFRRAYPDHRPFTGPVLLRFTAVFETPASFNKALKAAAARGTLYAVKKPDKDNIEKLIVDSLNGVAFHDDAQVMGGGVKRYGSPARLEISFESLESPDVPKTPGQRRSEAKQATFPLTAPVRGTPKPTKPKSTPPDLSRYDERTRVLIERALEREERARAARRK
jgi:Holliday junction resolvase RusA-like endonuclease